MFGKVLAGVIAGALSAYACAVVAQFGTPIDNALPLIAIAITILASITQPVIQIAVPLLMGGEIAIADERLRLLWFGMVLAIAFCIAIQKALGWRAFVVTALAILLLRWIPLANVSVARELLLLVVAIGIVFVLRCTPLAIAIGVATALFTPLVPLRTIGYAIFVLIVAAIFRPRVELRIIASLAVAIMLLFFAWSGVFARATLLALRGLPVATARDPMRMALAPGQSVTLDVPPDARAVILSAANVSRLKPGTVVGSINNAPLRIGDVADWGFLRREHHHASRNRIPNNPAGEVRDYGQAAWIDGAARFPVRGSVVVTASRALPANARLQIESFEMVKR